MPGKRRSNGEDAISHAPIRAWSISRVRRTPTPPPTETPNDTRGHDQIPPKRRESAADTLRHRVICPTRRILTT
jgi:hypothetical protein